MSRGKSLGGNFMGAVVQEGISRVIVQGTKVQGEFHGGNCPWGSCPGGECPNAILPFLSTVNFK